MVEKVLCLGIRISSNCVRRAKPWYPENWCIGRVNWWWYFRFKLGRLNRLLTRVFLPLFRIWRPMWHCRFCSWCSWHYEQIKHLSKYSNSPGVSKFEPNGFFDFVSCNSARVAGRLRFSRWRRFISASSIRRACSISSVLSKLWKNANYEKNKNLAASLVTSFSLSGRSDMRDSPRILSVPLRSLSITCWFCFRSKVPCRESSQNCCPLRNSVDTDLSYQCARRAVIEVVVVAAGRATCATFSMPSDQVCWSSRRPDSSQKRARLILIFGVSLFDFF